MQAEQCPPEDVFVRFLAGHLPDSEVVLLERHTSSCPPCMDLLTTAARLSLRNGLGLAPKVPRPCRRSLRVSCRKPPWSTKVCGPTSRTLASWGPTACSPRWGEGRWVSSTAPWTSAVARRWRSRPSAFRARDALLSLRREVHTLSQIRHPGVVRILEQGGTESDPPWYAMELVEGETLASRFRRSIGRQAELMTIVRRLCSTLSVLHASGVIHRDLSPRNVMVRPDGTPVLVDFGFALASGANPAARERLQREAAPAGTLLYMAPEQILGEPSDARADLYSLGCILYEALTGRPPFLGKSATAIIWGHLRNGPSPPSSLMPGLDARFDELTLRLIARQPRDRMAYADEVGQALDRIARRRATAGGKGRRRLSLPTQPGGAGRGDDHAGRAAAPMPERAGGRRARHRRERRRQDPPGAGAGRPGPTAGIQGGAGDLHRRGARAAQATTESGGGPLPARGAGRDAAVAGTARPPSRGIRALAGGGAGVQGAARGASAARRRRAYPAAGRARGDARACLLGGARP